MIPSQLVPAANHLWQSTLFGGVAGLLTLFLTKNRAHVRYWLWLIASVKFLLPFSILVAVGGLLGRHDTAAPSQLVSAANFSYFVEQVGEPFTTTVPQFAMPALQRSYASVIVAVLIVVWAAGFVTLVCRWTLRWRRIRASVRRASPLDLPICLPVKTSAVFGEPGVFGIFRPVLLLPDKIMDSLTAREMESIVAHELCHVRRRDNLATVIHMAVEVVFWFHPLVWWLGARLMEERERACDEEVLRNGGEPRIYAEGILKICELYLASPLACISGVTGGDLKRRIEAIISNRVALRLNFAKRFALAVAGMVAVAMPVFIGIIHAPPTQAQSPQVANPADPGAAEFEVTSVKLVASGLRSPVDPIERNLLVQIPRVMGSQFRMPRVPLTNLIEVAYNVKEFQVIGGPPWADSERYEIIAKVDGSTAPARVRLMLQSLMARRFKLKLHKETRSLPVYELTAAKTGLKIVPSKEETCVTLDLTAPLPRRDPNHPLQICGGVNREVVSPAPERRDRVHGLSIAMPALVEIISEDMGGIVVDGTGFTEKFDLNLEWAPGNVISTGRGPMPAGDTGTLAAPPLGVSMAAALQQQLGMRLEKVRRPVEVLVIDHVEKPSEN